MLGLQARATAHDPNLLDLTSPSSYSPTFFCFVLFCFATLFIFETGSHFVAQARVQWHNHSSLQPPTPGLKRLSHLNLWSIWDYWCAPPHLANFFILFFVQMESRYVSQADLKLLASSSSPTLPSQSAEITGMSQHARSRIFND